ncbi:hypothetical protein WMF30_10540 [Sorangium sp. So ce134]
MRSWLISAVMVLSCGAAACDNLMVEDSDDIGQIAAAIDAKTDAEKNFLSNEKVNKRARDWARANLDEEIGEYECPGGYKNKIARRDVLETLNYAQWYGYRLEEILKHVQPNDGCKTTWAPGALESLNEHLADARKDDDESTDSAYWLPTLNKEFLQEHEQLMTIIGVVVIGGVIVALPVIGVGPLLCPLSDAVLCPDDPGAPGIPQEQPGPGDEGDR